MKVVFSILVGSCNAYEDESNFIDLMQLKFIEDRPIATLKSVGSLKKME